MYRRTTSDIPSKGVKVTYTIPFVAVVRVILELWFEHLDGHGAMDRSLARGVDVTHTAFADPLQEPIVGGLYLGILRPLDSAWRNGQIAGNGSPLLG